VTFLQEMIIARSSEAEKNVKLDHNERKILTDKYKRLAAKLNRRFVVVPADEQDDNNIFVPNDTNPGHVFVLDGAVGFDMPSDEDNGTAYAVHAIGDRAIEDAKLVIIHFRGKEIVVKDRYGVTK
jgi:hypothetical protein